MTSREWTRVEPEHKRIIEPFLTEPPVKIATMARDLGLEVKSATLLPGISGEIRPSDTSPSGYKIRVNRHEVKTRQRFTIAHELAHYLLHRDLIGDGIIDSVLYRSNLSNTIEAQANRLAADLIMPADLISAELRKRGNRVDETAAGEIADIFETSVAAMKVRLGVR